MRRFNIYTLLLLLYLTIAATSAASLLYRPYHQMQFDTDVPMTKRSNAELINGLIGMDLNTLHDLGKRSNAELINGLLGMNLNKLSSAGKR